MKRITESSASLHNSSPCPASLVGSNPRAVSSPSRINQAACSAQPSVSLRTSPTARGQRTAPVQVADVLHIRQRVDPILGRQVDAGEQVRERHSVGRNGKPSVVPCILIGVDNGPTADVQDLSLGLLEGRPGVRPPRCRRARSRGPGRSHRGRVHHPPASGHRLPGRSHPVDRAAPTSRRAVRRRIPGPRAFPEPRRAPPRRTAEPIATRPKRRRSLSRNGRRSM